MKVGLGLSVISIDFGRSFMKMSKKLLLSALVAATMCGSGVSAVPHLSSGAIVGIGGGMGITLGGIVAGIIIGCGCSKKSDAPKQVSIPASKPEDFVPSIFDYDVISKEMLYDQLSYGSDLEKFIVDSVGGRKKFDILKKFFDKSYCHGNVIEDDFKTSKILKMSFEKFDSTGRTVGHVPETNVGEFFSRTKNREKIDFALYAVARCLDPLYYSATYKNLCKVTRESFMGFEFRVDKEDCKRPEDRICSVFVGERFIELRYQSGSRAFKCIFALD